MVAANKTKWEETVETAAWVWAFFWTSGLGTACDPSKVMYPG
jgi:hypothetical protein